jgi:hypothetical protein
MIITIVITSCFWLLSRCKRAGTYGLMGTNHSLCYILTRACRRENSVVEFTFCFNIHECKLGDREINEVFTLYVSISVSEKYLYCNFYCINI